VDEQQRYAVPDLAVSEAEAIALVTEHAIAPDLQSVFFSR
jgi:hypothetical protein